jgi:hypothetical protein
MEMKQITKNKNDYIIIYQKNGNDLNGNKLYLINVFKKVYDNYYNINAKFRNYFPLDKKDNIKIQSYNINETIDYILSKADYK